MLQRQGQRVKVVQHSTDAKPEGPIGPPEISPVLSRSWPSVPIVEWPLETIDEFFDEMRREVESREGD